jgi:enamine deaminase RidA (YjgF/YER057c/UK114 family)
MKERYFPDPNRNAWYLFNLSMDTGYARAFSLEGVDTLQIEEVIPRKVATENFMEIKTRRSFFGRMATIAVVIINSPKLFAHQAPASAVSPAPGSAPAGPGTDGPRRAGAGNHTHNGIYYFSGTGANDGYPKDDHVFVTDPFEKHVTRTMDALKKSVERAGCTMDSIINLQVFLCLPLADGIPMPTGKARFDAHKAQYDALNKIYGGYFSPGKAPSRACMALEWIPGDSLIEIVGSAMVVTSPAPPTPPAGE